MGSVKVLNLLDLTSIGVGSSLGIGVFVLIGELTKNVAGPAVVISIFVAGLASILAGLCLSEFGVRFLKVDSAYTYCYSYNRENVAFVVGWMLILEYAAGAASVTKGIVVFVDELIENKISNFLRETFPINVEYVSSYFDLVSLAVVLLLMLSVLCGMKDSLVLKKIFTFCNIGLLTAVIIASSFKADVANWYSSVSNEEGTEKSLTPFGFLGVIKGAALAMYGFVGFDNITTSGKEVRKIEKNVPLAIFGSIFITLVIFLGIGAVLTLMCRYSEHNVHAALPFAFEKIQWTAFKWIIAAGAFVGFQTSLFGVIFPLPRIIYSMANDGLLFHFLAKSHSKFKTPVVATLAGGLLTAVFATFFTFQRLVSLNVIGMLFACTILIIDVVLLRYAHKIKETEELAEQFTQEIFGHFLKHYFNFKSETPTKLTKKIVTSNVIIFCLSSAGLSIIFRFFSGSLFNLEIQTVLPASLLSCVMIFALISTMCQPKAQNMYSFTVPLMPLIPFLSIFLNIFLMVSLELSIWVLFSIWMALGIFPHLTWHCLKYSKGRLGENSLYEINKVNAMKLNESILKIKSEKESFYEGAINPVFYDESDEMKTTSDDCNANNVKKASLQLKEAEIIQMAELVMEEKVEAFRENEAKLTFPTDMSVGEIVENVPIKSESESETVQMECVAEIHTNEEFIEESVMLEIVDSTYHFLSEVVEEPVKDVTQNSSDANSLSFESKEFLENPTNKVSIKEDNSDSISEDEGRIVPLPPPFPNHSLLQENKDQNTGAKNMEESRHSTLERVMSELRRRTKNKTESVDIQKTEAFSKSSEVPSNDKKTGRDSSEGEKEENNNLVGNNHYSAENINEDEDKSSREKVDKNNDEQRKNSSKSEGDTGKKKFAGLIVQSAKDVPLGQIMNNKNVKITDENSVKLGGEPDERNKTKEFKKKLNMLLKNQINNSVIISKTNNKKIGEDNTDGNNQKHDEDIYNFKTLTKFQIKEELELLLSKGPPKRATLKNSFNIKDENKLKNSDKEEVSNIVVNINKPEGVNEDVTNVEPNDLKDKMTLPLNEGNDGVEGLPKDAFC